MSEQPTDGEQAACPFCGRRGSPLIQTIVGLVCESCYREAMGDEQPKTPAERHRARTLGVMHRRHGRAEGHTCGGCRSFWDKPVDGSIGHAFKCRQFRVSSSEATDWRKGWPACGLFVGES
jgi:hypothetical protein